MKDVLVHEKRYINCAFSAKRLSWFTSVLSAAEIKLPEDKIKNSRGNKIVSFIKFMYMYNVHLHVAMMFVINSSLVLTNYMYMYM